MSKVIITGWFGSKPKHLKKLADFYKFKGVEPVVMNPKLAMLITYYGATQIYPNQVKQHLKQPFFLHSFSQGRMATGGIYRSKFYQSELHLGTVLDSTNPACNMAWADRALTQEMRPKILGKAAYLLASPWLYPNIQLIHNSIDHLVDSNKAPHLYMHGTKDTICSYESMKKKVTEIYGNTDNLVTFEGEKHVTLLKNNPEKYFEHLDKFIEKNKK